MRWALLTMILACAPVAAVAADFAAYDGRDAVREGAGGTKVVTDGVEFWTAGTPPHRYRVLGVLTDTRGHGLLSGSVTGGSVAKHIRALGGDAAILMSQEDKTKGVYFGQNIAAPIVRQTTQLLVVKYEDAPAAP